MATAVQTQQTPIAGEQRFLLQGVSWQVYKMLCDDVDSRAYRLSYADGNLEIMTTGPPHEYYKTLLAKFIEQMLYEFNIAVRSGGSMTFQREDLQKGLEPDECWWIAREAAVRGKEKFDFRSDPAPDLAVEVEITSSLVNRISIYAAMGVAEIWRFNGRELRFCLLQHDGSYADSTHSAAFTFLRPEHLIPYLKIDDAVDETTRLRRFMDEVRSRHQQP